MNLFYCPNTGEILSSIQNPPGCITSKIFCLCGKTNPILAGQGIAEPENTHYTEYLIHAPKLAWLLQAQKNPTSLNSNERELLKELKVEAIVTISEEAKNYETKSRKAITIH